MNRRIGLLTLLDNEFGFRLVQIVSVDRVPAWWPFVHVGVPGLRCFGGSLVPAGTSLCSTLSSPSWLTPGASLLSEKHLWGQNAGIFFLCLGRFRWASAVAESETLNAASHRRKRDRAGLFSFHMCFPIVCCFGKLGAPLWNGSSIARAPRGHIRQRTPRTLCRISFAFNVESVLGNNSAPPSYQPSQLPLNR